MTKNCPIRADGVCLKSQCAWFWQPNDSREADSWGECAVLSIAEDLWSITAYNPDVLGLVHVHISSSYQDDELHAGRY